MDWKYILEFENKHHRFLKKRERDLCAGRFCLSANCLFGPLCIKKILSWFGLLSKTAQDMESGRGSQEMRKSQFYQQRSEIPAKRSHSHKQTSGVDRYCCKREPFAHCGCSRFTTMVSALPFRGEKIPPRTRKKTTADGSVYIFMTCW